MFRIIFLSTALIFSVASFADGHSDAEKTVLKNIEAYWDARNDRDWDTVVALTSSSGMLGTNSDGSFHKACLKSSVAYYEKNLDAGFKITQEGQLMGIAAYKNKNTNFFIRINVHNFFLNWLN